MSMQRWAENVLETTKKHFQNVLESLSNLGGQKRVVLGNAQCLARQPSLALAELLKHKAGFQVQSQFWHHFVMVLAPYPMWRPTLYLDKKHRWCKLQLGVTWDLLHIHIKFFLSFFIRQSWDQKRHSPSTDFGSICFFFCIFSTVSPHWRWPLPLLVGYNSLWVKQLINQSYN